MISRLKKQLAAVELLLGILWPVILYGVLIADAVSPWLQLRLEPNQRQ